LYQLFGSSLSVSDVLIKDNVDEVFRHILYILAPYKAEAGSAVVDPRQDGGFLSLRIESNRAEAGKVHLTQQATHGAEIDDRHGFFSM
jgi:hypothetical protein